MIEIPLTQAPRAQIKQLTGIRGVAATWVLLFHFRPELVQAFPVMAALTPIMNVGHLGVDLFFVLSGLILTITHLEGMSREGWNYRSALGFLWLRLSRVWPLTAASLVIWGVYLAARATLGSAEARAGLTPGRLLEHLLLIQAWGDSHHDWNPIDWSVSAEWLAYIFFALATALFAKLQAHTRPVARVVLAGAVLIPIVCVGISLQDGSDLLWNGDQIISGIVPLRVLSEFTAGALLATTIPSFNRASTSRVPLPTLAALMIVGTLYTLARFDWSVNFRFGQDWLLNGVRLWGPSESALIIPLLALLIFSLAIFRNDPLSRLLSTRPLVWLGKVSFALYLIHWLYLDMFRRVTGIAGITPGPTPPYIGSLLLTLGAAVISGWLMWRFIEEPARRLLRKFLPKGIAL